MWDFFRPSRLKLLLTGALVVYLVISLFYLAPLSPARNIHQPPQMNFAEKGVALVAAPAVILVFPAIYVSSNVFTATGVSYSELLRSEGCVGCNSAVFDSPTRQSTPLGLATGIVFEILMLYCLACVVATLIHKAPRP